MEGPPPGRPLTKAVLSFGTKTTTSKLSSFDEMLNQLL
jgi:hypothetical protein